MRRPTILDLVQAVVEVAPSHPEVAVWWYARASGVGAAPVTVVLEARDGAAPEIDTLGLDLARRLGPSAVAVRMHRGAAEAQELYRLLTAADASEAAGHAKGW
jgi:hypothetical protein